jgi:hypothetical protein
LPLIALIRLRKFKQQLLCGLKLATPDIQLLSLGDRCLQLLLHH